MVVIPFLGTLRCWPGTKKPSYELGTVCNYEVLPNDENPHIYPIPESEASHLSVSPMEALDDSSAAGRAAAGRPGTQGKHGAGGGQRRAARQLLGDAVFGCLPRRLVLPLCDQPERDRRALRLRGRHFPPV